MFGCHSETQVSWLHNGKPLPENSVQLSYNVLFLKNIQLEDAGFYSCISTTNDHTSIKTKGTLIVYGKLLIITNFIL